MVVARCSKSAFFHVERVSQTAGGLRAYFPGRRAPDFQTTASAACLLVACKGALLFAPMAVVAGPQNHVLKRAEVDISMS